LVQHQEKRRHSTALLPDLFQEKEKEKKREGKTIAWAAL
jgi:hypothetical protein